jgi:hypothetical protein
LTEEHVEAVLKENGLKVYKKFKYPISAVITWVLEIDGIIGPTVWLEKNCAVDIRGHNFAVVENALRASSQARAS